MIQTPKSSHMIIWQDEQNERCEIAMVVDTVEDEREKEKERNAPSMHQASARSSRSARRLALHTPAPSDAKHEAFISSVKKPTFSPNNQDMIRPTSHDDEKGEDSKRLVTSEGGEGVVEREIPRLFTPSLGQGDTLSGAEFFTAPRTRREWDRAVAGFLARYGFAAILWVTRPDINQLLSSATPSKLHVLGPRSQLRPLRYLTMVCPLILFHYNRNISDHQLSLVHRPPDTLHIPRILACQTLRPQASGSSNPTKDPNSPIMLPILLHHITSPPP
ncbi:LOW QUALITY PROTEIN: hypothetical protein CVT26_005326 [Gymnopilus dilepis]|uniref:Uncharacterized protein n=1 Tax=Gymnopilus dilepis TaxID=231916 RepID=A0A409WJ56_9AGAR|nr:LOW QUALITY PROTEIN: hypothetical protein CVT26_005326 [Gymnopilus dilepis]